MERIDKINYYLDIAETVIEKSKVKKTAQTALEQEYTSNENN